MNTANIDPGKRFSTSTERPWYLTGLAVLLLLWGAGSSLPLVTVTLEALTSGRGPAFLLFFFVYMHILWWTLFIAGIGIFLGAGWSRWVMSAALVGLLIGTAFQPFATQMGVVIKVIAYPLIIWLAFTKRASTYFAAKRRRQEPRLRVEPTHEG